MTGREVFGLGALAAFAAGCGESKNGSQIVATGHVEATEVRLSAKVGGRLEWFELEEGDSVGSGQELGRLETIDTRLALDQARAERARAAAELNLLLAGTREEEIAAAAADVRRAQADVDGAQREFERMQGLLDSGSGTTKARDDARTRLEVAQAVLAANRERLRKLEAGPRPEEIDAARAQVQAAEARMAQLEQQIRDSTIVAPASGVVTEKLVEPGELLVAGAALAVITELADAWLTVYISEPDLGRIRIGQEAVVVTDDGQTRRGKVTFIASQAEFTPKNVQTRDERVKLVFKLKIGIDNHDGLFKPGMPAEARLQAAERAA